MDLSRGLLGTNTKRVDARHSLGWHPADHKPGLMEYIIYEELRDKLLSRPYRRAALLHGGIVWRLALHTFTLRKSEKLLKANTLASMSYLNEASSSSNPGHFSLRS